MQAARDHKYTDLIRSFMNPFNTKSIEKKASTKTDDVEKSQELVTSDGTYILPTIQTSGETNRQINSENVDPDRDLVEKTNNLRKSLGLKPWKTNENQAKNINATVHKKQQKFKCSDCDYTSSKNEYVIDHIKKSHQKTFKCNQCDYTNTVKKFVINHMKITHSITPKKSQHSLQNAKLFKCTECDYSNIINDYVMKHMQIVHDKSFECKKCDFKTKEKTEYFKHVEAHENPYKCYECDYENVSVENVYKHIKETHAGCYDSNNSSNKEESLNHIKELQGYS